MAHVGAPVHGGLQRFQFISGFTRESERVLCKPGVVQVPHVFCPPDTSIAPIALGHAGVKEGRRVVELAVVHRLVVVFHQGEQELLGCINVFGVLGDDVVVDNVLAGPARPPRASERRHKKYILGNLRHLLLAAAVSGDRVEDVGSFAGDEGPVV